MVLVGLAVAGVLVLLLLLAVALAVAYPKARRLEVEPDAAGDPIAFRRGAAHQLTRDHSVVQSLTDAGLLSESSSARGVDRTMLYAAVGAEGDTRPVGGAGMKLEDGDVFLLCTDGVWDSAPTAFINSARSISLNYAAAAQMLLALGQSRATMARNYLVSLGIAPERFVVISLGEERPVCSQSDEACWQQNRRGHFVITAK